MSSCKYFMHIQDENKFSNIKKNDRKEGGMNFLTATGSMESCGGTQSFFSCSVYNMPTLFSKSTKEIFNLQVVWHSPNTFHIVFHRQAYCIITLQSPQSIFTPLESTGQLCELKSGNHHQYQILKEDNLPWFPIFVEINIKFYNWLCYLTPDGKLVIISFVYHCKINYY